MQLPKLNLPPWTPRLRKQAEGVQIYDRIRELWVTLTPEEWVRQSLLWHLTEQLAYAKGLLIIERKVEVNALAQRADIVALARDGTPFLLVECKAPQVALSEDTAMQALRYNASVGAPWVALSNGIEHRVYHRATPQQPFVLTGAQFPPYPQREAGVCPPAPCSQA